MGFGPGAYSYVNGVRYSYVKDLDRYISAVVGDKQIIDEYEACLPVQKAAEYIMLGMRTVRGISEDEYHKIYLSDWTPMERKFEEFEKKGWAERDGSRWRLTPSGFLVSNSLIISMLESQTEAKVEYNPWMKNAFAAQEKEPLPQGDLDKFKEFYRKQVEKG